MNPTYQATRAAILKASSGISGSTFAVVPADVAKALDVPADGWAMAVINGTVTALGYEREVIKGKTTDRYLICAASFGRLNVKRRAPKPCGTSKPGVASQFSIAAPKKEDIPNAQFA